MRKVKGYGFKLQGSAALNEDNIIFFGYGHEFSQKALRFVVDFLVGFGAVAHFHYGHACPFVIDKVFLHLFKHFKRQHGRTC